jgi:hypothetical protein
MRIISPAFYHTVISFIARNAERYQLTYTAPVHDITPTAIQTSPPRPTTSPGHRIGSHPIQCNRGINIHSRMAVTKPIELVRKLACKAAGSSTGSL